VEDDGDSVDRVLLLFCKPKESSRGTGQLDGRAVDEEGKAEEREDRSAGGAACKGVTSAVGEGVCEAACKVATGDVGGEEAMRCGWG